MENEKLENEIIKKDNPYSTQMAIVIVGVLILGAMFYNSKNPINKTPSEKIQIQTSTLEEAVLPSDGVVLPVVWG
ncbi:MAG: hypothetical protein Q8N88_05085, partial [Nanoarchaeota archaeon]|nr:hypothetical protein [Nanoarchaeota archaeon]